MLGYATVNWQGNCSEKRIAMGQHRDENCWGGPYENIEKIETFISEIFKMLGYDLTFLTYKLPNFGGFE